MDDSTVTFCIHFVTLLLAGHGVVMRLWSPQSKRAKNQHLLLFLGTIFIWLLLVETQAGRAAEAKRKAETAQASAAKVQGELAESQREMANLQWQLVETQLKLAEKMSQVEERTDQIKKQGERPLRRVIEAGRRAAIDEAGSTFATDNDKRELTVTTVLKNFGDAPTRAEVTVRAFLRGVEVSLRGQGPKRFLLAPQQSQQWHVNRSFSPEEYAALSDGSATFEIEVTAQYEAREGESVSYRYRGLVDLARQRVNTLVDE